MNYQEIEINNKKRLSWNVFFVGIGRESLNDRKIIVTVTHLLLVPVGERGKYCIKEESIYA